VAISVVSVALAVPAVSEALAVQAELEVLAVPVELVGPVASVAPAELEAWEESVVRVAGTAFRPFRPVAETEATGSIGRNIAAVPPIATGLRQIVLAGPRVVIPSPTVKTAHASNLAAKAATWEAIVVEALA